MTQRIHNRLPRTHRRVVYALVTVLTATGAAWLVVSYLAVAPGEPTPAPHAWSGSLLALHGIAAYAALFAFAFVGHAHVRTGWRIPALRAAGCWLLASIAVLAATGLALYYVATEAAIPVARWLHVAAGVALLVALTIHIRDGRRAARLTRAR